MNPLLLKSYKLEYETTDIPLDKITKKYNIDIMDTKDWKKKKKTEPQTIVEKPKPLAEKPPNDMEEEIIAAKKKAISQVKAYFDNIDLSDEIEVKEFKDMVGVLTNLGDSIKKKDDGPTVNVLIQNLMASLKDDC